MPNTVALFGSIMLSTPNIPHAAMGNYLGLNFGLLQAHGVLEWPLQASQAGGVASEAGQGELPQFSQAQGRAPSNVVHEPWRYTQNEGP